MKKIPWDVFDRNRPTWSKNKSNVLLFVFFVLWLLYLKWNGPKAFLIEFYMVNRWITNFKVQENSRGFERPFIHIVRILTEQRSQTNLVKIGNFYTAFMICVLLGEIVQCLFKVMMWWNLFFIVYSLIKINFFIKKLQT